VLKGLFHEKGVVFVTYTETTIGLNEGYDVLYKFLNFFKLPDAFRYFKIYLFFSMRTTVDKFHNVELVFVQAFPASCWSVVFENFFLPPGLSCH
jgi:hypothetical protein